MHAEAEVRDGEDTRMSKRVFVYSLSLRSIRRHETVPRAETAPPPSSGLLVTPVVFDGLLVYVRMYVVIYNLLTEAVSTPEYMDITSEGSI